MDMPVNTMTTPRMLKVKEAAPQVPPLASMTSLTGKVMMDGLLLGCHPPTPGGPVTRGPQTSGARRGTRVNSRMPTVRRDLHLRTADSHENVLPCHHGSLI